MPPATPTSAPPKRRSSRVLDRDLRRRESAGAAASKGGERPLEIEAEPVKHEKVVKKRREPVWKAVSFPNLASRSPTEVAQKTSQTPDTPKTPETQDVRGISQTPQVPQTLQTSSPAIDEPETPTTFPHFMELPLELREMVYKEYFSHEIREGPDRSSNVNPKGFSMGLGWCAILETSLWFEASSTHIKIWEMHSREVREETLKAMTQLGHELRKSTQALSESWLDLN